MFKKIKNTVKVVTVDNNLQSFETDYCWAFQICFYLNLFEPLNTSAVAKHSSKKLDVKLIGGLLKELFNTRTSQNKRILDAFIMQHDEEFDRDETSDREEESKN